MRRRRDVVKILRRCVDLIGMAFWEADKLFDKVGLGCSFDRQSDSTGANEIDVLGKALDLGDMRMDWNHPHPRFGPDLRRERRALSCHFD